MPVFRVTQPYLNVLLKPGVFSGFLDFFIAFRKAKCLSKCIKKIKKNRKKHLKKCVPTLPKIFRPVTRNTLFILCGLHVRIQFSPSTNNLIYII